MRMVLGQVSILLIVLCFFTVGCNDAVDVAEQLARGQACGDLALEATDCAGDYCSIAEDDDPFCLCHTWQALDLDTSSCTCSDESFLDHIYDACVDYQIEPDDFDCTVSQIAIETAAAGCR